MTETITLSRALGFEMLAHIRRNLPEEACGIVAGQGGRGTRVLAVTNMLHDPVRFRMEPKEQLDALMWLEANGQDLLAIFHSHPTGPAVPSETDVAEFYYPEAVVLIWAPGADGWQARAFRIEDGKVGEVSIAWEDSETG